MSQTVTLTSAEALGRYRKELLAEGMPDDLVADLIRIAANHLMEDSGLGVKAVAE